MTGLTRGRLPARVYWVRRLLVLGTALLLMVGIARLLGGSSDGSSGPDRATTVADSGSPVTESAASDGPSPDGTPGAGRATTNAGKQSKQHPPEDVTAAALPSGPCAPDDIAITPSVPHPTAGSDIDLVLDVSTVTSPACYWTLSGRTLALKITSGADLIWTSVECARAITKQDLVLTSAEPTRVRLTWSARRSAPGCPKVTEWALPGTYHLHVAALAGRPQDVTFDLVAPPTPQVTRTAHPRRHHHQGG